MWKRLAADLGANTAMSSKHRDAIIIGDFARAGGDPLYEDGACSKTESQHWPSILPVLSRMVHAMPVRDIASSTFFREVCETQLLSHVGPSHTVTFPLKKIRSVKFDHFRNGILHRQQQEDLRAPPRLALSTLAFVICWFVDHSESNCDANIGPALDVSFRAITPCPPCTPDF